MHICIFIFVFVSWLGTGVFAVGPFQHWITYRDRCCPLSFVPSLGFGVWQLPFALGTGVTDSCSIYMEIYTYSSRCAVSCRTCVRIASCKCQFSVASGSYLSGVQSKATRTNEARRGAVFELDARLTCAFRINRYSTFTREH